jgi:hypothetical protein
MWNSETLERTRTQRVFSWVNEFQIQELRESAILSIRSNSADAGFSLSAFSLYPAQRSNTRESSAIRSGLLR